MELSEEEWKKKLTPEQYRILRKKGTEKAFTGEYWDLKEAGSYLCAGCGSSLFSSEDKYDSGTGWPSFTKPVEEAACDYEGNEVLCKNCRGHLGHVFDDGPTGNRFCINSGALKFKR